MGLEIIFRHEIEECQKLLADAEGAQDCGFWSGYIDALEWVLEVAATAGGAA